MKQQWKVAWGLGAKSLLAITYINSLLKYAFLQIQKQEAETLAWKSEHQIKQVQTRETIQKLRILNKQKYTSNVLISQYKWSYFLS